MIAQELWDNLVELGAPEYTEGDEVCQALSEGVGDSRFESLEKIAKSCKDKAAKASPVHMGESMSVLSLRQSGRKQSFGPRTSVSGWNCPTAQAYVATWRLDTGPLLAGRFPGPERTGTQGTDLRGKAMAGAAIDMYAVRRSSRRRTRRWRRVGWRHLHCPIPDGCKPRAMGMKM